MAFGDSKFVARVKVFPFFPDAPTCESEAVSAFCRANAAEPAANPSRSASAFSSETRFTGASVRFVGGALCSRLTFTWTLSRLCDASGLDRYGELESCWMVHDVTADFEGWVVHNP
eukprot:scaffold44080_cov36-Tisochrysis_lutea.AAC.3